MKKLYELLAAAFGLWALVTQFIVSTPAFVANGMSMGGALLQFFSFFTILTNIAVVLFYLAALLDWNVPFLRSPKWQTAMAVYIAIVALIYIAVLQAIWDPMGIFKVLDISLHYVAPALFILYWLIFVQHGHAAYRDTPVWLMPGLAYAIYALIRGALTGLYPYPFLDAGALGYLTIARNAVFLLFFFFMMGLLFTGIDRLLAKLKTRTREL